MPFVISLEQENLKAYQDKEIEIKRLETILENNKEFMERQARQIVSLKSKYITSQILNKKTDLAKVQQKSTPIKEEERKWISQQYKEIQELRHQLVNLRIETQGFQTQIIHNPPRNS